MKRKIILLLGVLAAFTFGLALTGCASHGLTLEDIANDGYSVRVTFDLMGGKAGERTQLIQYVRENSLVVLPGSKQLTGSEPAREGYTFGGYFHGSKDDEGNVEYGDAWNFSSDRVSADTTIYVKWLENYSIIVHYGEGYAQESIVSVAQTSEGVALPITFVEIARHTIVGLFASQADAESKQNAITVSSDAPYTPQGLSQENTKAHLWANTIEGSWTLVEKASQLVINNITNIYLLGDIDLEGEVLSLPERYSGTIEGNGFTISNFKVTQEMKQGRETFSYGLFTELLATAVIRNVTFANVTYEGHLTNPTATEYRAGILAGVAWAGASVENVTVTGTFTFNVVSSYRGEERPFYDSIFVDGDKTLIGATSGGSDVNITGVNVDDVKLVKNAVEA